MLVGPTMAGKTAAYRTLSKAMTALAVAGHAGFKRVRTWVLNPKSITMGQLYGQFDEITHEWTDGVLACCMREAAQVSWGGGFRAGRWCWVEQGGGSRLLRHWSHCGQPLILALFPHLTRTPPPTRSG
jgi:hypothetical protein